MDYKSILLIIAGIAIVALVIMLGFSLSDNPTALSPKIPDPKHFAERTIPGYFLWAAVPLVIIAAVPLSYYYTSRRLEKKMEANIKLISKIAKTTPEKRAKNPGQSNDMILKFLNGNERIVVKRLIESKGSALQSEISRSEGMNKVKTHRTVRDLERKGIIKTEAFGKTRKLILTDEVKKSLL